MSHPTHIFALALLLLGATSATAVDAADKVIPSNDKDASGESRVLTSEECTNLGGRIVNSLSGESCKSSETLTGAVSGMRCECKCCVPIDTKETKK